MQRQEGTEAKGEEGEGTGAAGSRLTDLTDGTKDLGGASARGCWQLVQERSSGSLRPPRPALAVHPSRRLEHVPWVGGQSRRAWPDGGESSPTGSCEMLVPICIATANDR